MARSQQEGCPAPGGGCPLRPGATSHTRTNGGVVFAGSRPSGGCKTPGLPLGHEVGQQLKLCARQAPALWGASGAWLWQWWCCGLCLIKVCRPMWRAKKGPMRVSEGDEINSLLTWRFVRPPLELSRCQGSHRHWSGGASNPRRRAVVANFFASFPNAYGASCFSFPLAVGTVSAS